jgi:hypothetical protein
MSDLTEYVLFVRENKRRYRPATSTEVFLAARDVVERHFKRDVKISDPASVRRYLSLTMSMLTRESMRRASIRARW